MTVTADAQEQDVRRCRPGADLHGCAPRDATASPAAWCAWPARTSAAYAINQGTLSAGSNYTLTFVGANLTISARPVTVTADAKSKTYGDADPALTYTGALHGTDSFTGSLARATGEDVGSLRDQAGHAERRQQLRADLRRREPDDHARGR